MRYMILLWAFYHLISFPSFVFAGIVFHGSLKRQLSCKFSSKKKIEALDVGVHYSTYISLAEDVPELI